MKITIERRDQYGQPVYFPLDATGQTFARIAKTKTLTPDALAGILGPSEDFDGLICALEDAADELSEKEATE